MTVEKKMNKCSCLKVEQQPMLEDRQKQQKVRFFRLTFDVWAQQAGCLHSALVQKSITTRQKQVDCVRKLL